MSEKRLIKKLKSTETSIFNVEGVFVHPEPNRERHNNWNLRKSLTMDDICFFYCWMYWMMKVFFKKREELTLSNLKEQGKIP